MKTATEILKEAITSVSGEVIYKNIRESNKDQEMMDSIVRGMEEYASQFKVELSEGEINKMADEYLKTVGSIRYVNECRLDFINGFKQGLSYNREDTAVAFAEWMWLNVRESSSVQGKWYHRPKNIYIKNHEELFKEYLNSIKGK